MPSGKALWTMLCLIVFVGVFLAVLWRLGPDQGSSGTGAVATVPGTAIPGAIPAAGGAPTASGAPQPALPNTPPTAAPMPAATAAGAPDPPPSTQLPARQVLSDVFVAAANGSGTPFVAPQAGIYSFTVKATGQYCTGSAASGGKCRSIVRGYLDGDIAWGDERVFIDHPVGHKYQLGCWENTACVDTVVTARLQAGQQILWVIMEDRQSFQDNVGGVSVGVVWSP